MKKLTHLEFLNDTVSFYSADPKGRRALNQDGECVYLAEDGRKCAIGRYIKEDEKEAFNNLGTLAGLLSEHPNCLKPSIANLSQNFLARIQNLHDGDRNWDEFGLTEFGKATFEVIKDYAIELDSEINE